MAKQMSDLASYAALAAKLDAYKTARDTYGVDSAEELAAAADCEADADAVWDELRKEHGMGSR